MPLTPEQVSLIKATIPVLQEHGTTITTTFYRNMLHAHPELYSIFNKTNQTTGQQPAALANSLLAYATHIDDLGALSPAVSLIVNKHASLYVQPDQYEIVGKFLLEAMQQVLGTALTPDLLEAWKAAYWQLANVLIGEEADLYREADGWTDWRDFTIVDKVPESSEITSFYLKPTATTTAAEDSKLPSFKPGQYIGVQVRVPALQGQLQARQYSLSEQPRKDYYRISVRKDEGGASGKFHPGYVSNVLHENYGVGDTIRVSHPAGDFFLQPENEEGDDKPIVLIAAGVGLTPLTSMLNYQVGQSNNNKKIHFIHGAHSIQSRAFQDHIGKLLLLEKPDFRATFFTTTGGEISLKGKGLEEGKGTGLTQLRGHVDLKQLDAVKDLFVDDPRTEYYVCGPTGFMSAVKTQLVDGLHVGPERVRMEVFGTGGV